MYVVFGMLFSECINIGENLVKDDILITVEAKLDMFNLTRLWLGNCKRS